MKVKIGKYTYRKASDLRKVMDKAPRTEKEVKLLVYLIGIYSCRFWGFVRYRTKAGFDTDKIQIGRKLSECTTDDASAGDCNKPHVSINEGLESCEGVAVCGKKNCNEPIYEFGLCFKHYCISEDR